MIDASESSSRLCRTCVPGGPRGFLRRDWASSRPLTFVGAAMLLPLAAAMVGLLLDPWHWEPGEGGGCDRGAE